MGLVRHVPSDPRRAPGGVGPPARRLLRRPELNEVGVTMNRLAYDSLAREVLWLLLDGGRLRPATLDHMVAWQVFFLPPRVLLEVPDEDRFAPLLDPRSRAEHAAMLGAALLHVATTEDRDGWVVWTPTVEVEVRFAEGRRHPTATPSYDPSRRPPPPIVEAGEAGDPLVRAAVGDEAIFLKRGEGLVPVYRGGIHPRVTLVETAEPDAPPDCIAWLLVDGAARVEHGDGRVESLPPCSRIPVRRDLRVVVRGAGLRRLWRRPLVVSVEVLGAARMGRPALALRHGAELLTWDRNREPKVVVGDAPDARLTAPGLDVELCSEPGDVVVARNRSAEPTWLRWAGEPLRLWGRQQVRLCASHLSGIGAGGGSVEVRLEGAPSVEAPRTFTVQGRLVRSRRAEAPSEPLFGFEQAVATVFQDGLLLDAEPDGALLHVPVDDPGLVRPLLRIALDGCGGAKVMALEPSLRAIDCDLVPDAWTFVPDVVAFAVPGLRLRLEAAAGRPRLIYGLPVRVCDVSADPEDRWSLHGWRFRVAANGLAVNGTGEPAITVDHRQVDGPALLPPAPEHHVEAGSGMYRIVRLGRRASLAREA